MESAGINVFKLARFVHYNRFFEQINILSEKILGAWGISSQKVSEYVDLLKLQMTVILITHVLTCLWIYIGTFTSDGWVVLFKANMANEFGESSDNYIY